VPVHLHKDDLFLYEDVVQHGLMFGLKVRPQPPIDSFYDGSTFPFGDYVVKVHHTPGHCPGGVCLEVERPGQPGPKHLFVGDTLFAGSIGRTDLPGGNYDVLLRAITGVLLPLGDDAIVHPGHGPDTTIGRERQTNPFILEYVRRH
jgi:glyoxylase-like metal-dependent hydrolase (beta-lactamase superfamily II)